MSTLPVIAIVGRQNVGKSSLLNAMAGRRISIVDPKPGVTRDRVSAVVELAGAAFELVDTAGIGLEREDRFYESVERQIRFAIEKADLIMFVVDAIEGVTARDKEVARRLRRSGKNVMLVANKSDNPRFDARIPEMGELGFGDAYAVSCAHRRFVGELVEEVLRRLPGAPAGLVPPRSQSSGATSGSTLVSALGEGASSSTRCRGRPGTRSTSREGKEQSTSLTRPDCGKRPRPRTHRVLFPGADGGGRGPEPTP
jgi:small GTP-binding protein